MELSLVEKPASAEATTAGVTAMLPFLHRRSVPHDASLPAVPPSSTHRALRGASYSLLDWIWSPQQISGTLRRMYSNDSTQQVSQETIYTAIYARPYGELRRQLFACLRHHRTDRMPRSRGTDRRGQIPDMVSIRSARPKSMTA
jgi:IS30 family transposase